MILPYLANANGMLAAETEEVQQIGKSLTYKHCNRCHNLTTEDTKKKMGPVLLDIVGSKLASKDYKYSIGMQKFVSKEGQLPLPKGGSLEKL